MSKPVLAAGLLAMAGGAWYWALLPPGAPPGVAVRGAPRAAAEASVPVVRLERLLDARVEPASGTGRDPFRRSRAAAAPRAAAVPAAAPPARPPDAPAVSTPSWPRLELIGVAERREDGALVRTAIVSGPLGVHHVRPGETVEQVYRLERVAADGVELRLLPEDRVVRIALRP